MLGWDSTCSRDYEECVVNGLVDSDLEGMRGVIEVRIKERDGVKRCPDCGELLEREHVHDGFIVTPLSEPPF